MFKNIEKQWRGYYASIWVTAAGLTGGAITHTVEGTWDMLTPVGIVTYIVGGGMVASTATVSFSHWALNRETSKAIESPFAERDNFGFRVHQDWAFVARLEHHLGFPHMGETEQYCGRSECWKEVQSPTYEWGGDYLTITAWPELPEEKASPALATDSTGRLIEPDMDIVEQSHFGTQGMTWGLKTSNKQRRENYRLKNELEARKARGQGYIPADITKEAETKLKDEARRYAEAQRVLDIVEQGYEKYGHLVVPDGYSVFMEEHHGESMVRLSKPGCDSLWINPKAYTEFTPTITAQPYKLGEAKPLIELPVGKSYTTAEINSIMAKFKEQADKGQVMTVPAGFTVSHRRGGEMIQLSAPDGKVICVPFPSEQDRRRDEVTAEKMFEIMDAMEAVQNCMGAGKKQRPSDDIRMEQIRNY